MHVRVKGNLSEGFEAIGPYADFDAAASGGDGWVMGMTFGTDLSLPDGLHLTRAECDGNFEIRDEKDVTWLSFPHKGNLGVITRVCAVLGVVEAHDRNAAQASSLSVEEYVRNFSK